MWTCGVVAVEHPPQVNSEAELPATRDKREDHTGRIGQGSEVEPSVCNAWVGDNGEPIEESLPER